MPDKLELVRFLFCLYQQRTLQKMSLVHIEYKRNLWTLSVVLINASANLEPAPLNLCIIVQTWKLKRFRFFPENFPFFSGLFQVFFRPYSGKRQEKHQKKTENFPEKSGIF